MITRRQYDVMTPRRRLFGVNNVRDEGNLLGFWIIFRPLPNKLIQVMGSEYRPISCQVVEVVHDDSDKQVNNLLHGHR